MQNERLQARAIRDLSLSAEQTATQAADWHRWVRRRKALSATITSSFGKLTSVLPCEQDLCMVIRRLPGSVLQVSPAAEALGLSGSPPRSPSEKFHEESHAYFSKIFGSLVKQQTKEADTASDSYGNDCSMHETSATSSAGNAAKEATPHVATRQPASLASVTTQQHHAAPSSEAEPPQKDPVSLNEQLHQFEVPHDAAPLGLSLIHISEPTRPY